MKVVSIPHRYDKNEDGRFMDMKTSEFQSLIGTIKTLKRDNYLCQRCRFNPS